MGKHGIHKYYFSSAVILLLQQKDLPFRGKLLEHFLLTLMRELQEEYVHQGTKTKIPGLRFAAYRKVTIPTKEKWLTSTMEVIQLCLEASFRPHPPGDKKDRAMVYEQTRKAVAKEIPDGGLKSRII
jgi:hypothetical protein